MADLQQVFFQQDLCRPDDLHSRRHSPTMRKKKHGKNYLSASIIEFHSNDKECPPNRTLCPPKQNILKIAYRLMISYVQSYIQMASMEGREAFNTRESLTDCLPPIPLPLLAVTF